MYDFADVQFLHTRSQAYSLDNVLFAIANSFLAFSELIPGFYVPESVKEEPFYNSPTFDVKTSHLS